MKQLRHFAIFLVLFGAPAFGQGCAMCKANLAAAPIESQRALRRGILTLLMPSLGAIALLGAVVYKNRD